MVSPQQRHTRAGVLSSIQGKRPMVGIKGVLCGTCDSTETGGSATELSATDAWHRATVGYEANVTAY
jgi:hypothetical protein